MIVRTLIIISALLFGSGAHASEPTDAAPPSESAGTPRIALKTLPEAIQNLLRYALSQDGVSYRRGGTSPEIGFDCSGFVRHVFDHVEGLMLPHSAKALSQIGNRVKMTELHPGDLVFFRIVRHSVSHVGIYLGNNRFIHASSTHTGSVTISDLTDGYWARHFTLARRLDLPAGQAATVLE